MDPLSAASNGNGEPSTTINGSHDSHGSAQQQKQNSVNRFTFTSWEELRGSQSAMETGSEEEDDSLEMHSAESDNDSGNDTQHRDGRKYDRLLQVQESESTSDLEDGDEGDNDDLLLAEPLSQRGHHKQSSSNSKKQHHRRRRRRRVYGGGRYITTEDDTGQRRGILSTSFHLSIASLSPCSFILLPYAYSLTGGLSFGIPITLLLLILGQYFSHSLLVVEGRYVGSRSYHTLGGAVFPQAPRLRNLGKYAGQILVLVFQVLVDGGRTLVALILATQLLTDLSLAAFPRAPAILHNHVFLALVVGLPTLLFSTLSHIARRPLLPLRWTRYARQIPQYALPLFILPLVILSFGISLKNLDDYPSLTKPGHGHLKIEKPSYSSAPLQTPSLWSGVSIIFLVVGSTHSSTFPLYRALKKRNALPASSSSSTLKRGASATLGLSAGGGTGQTIDDGGPISPGLSGGPSSGNNNISGDGSSSIANTGGGSAIGGLPSSFLTRHVQSHRFETSTLLSCLLTGIFILPFGIIGYLSLLVIRPNVFETLPRNHGGFNTCRILLVLGIVGNIRRVGENAVVAAMRILGIAARAMRRGGAQGKHGDVGAGRRSGRKIKRSNNNKHKRRNSELELGQVDDHDHEAAASERGSDQHSEDEEDVYSSHASDASGDDEEGLGHSYSHSTRHRKKKKIWIALLANVSVWGTIVALACVKGKELSGIAEVVGCVGCGMLGFVLPALFHIILFHLRRPRTIVLTSASSLSLQTDALLLSKERQLQRRLMGKRIGLDVGAFGLLLPVGMVGIARGVWAIANG